MTGGDGDNRGLIPRAIEEVYANIEKSKGNIEVCTIIDDNKQATWETFYNQSTVRTEH